MKHFKADDKRYFSKKPMIYRFTIIIIMTYQLTI